MKKTRSECAAVRESLSRGLPASDQQPHLFRCPACRVRVRISIAFKGLPRRKTFDPLADSVDPIFVQRVVAAVRRDRQRRIQTRVSLAAAAALLFFFFLGAGHHAASSSTTGVEDAYAQLMEPSGLDSLLPD
jgi:anti-sigma factor RsiW